MNLFKSIKEGNCFSFWVICTILGAVFTLGFLAYTGNSTQQYTDIVAEWTAEVMAHKSSEMFLLYFLSFFGLVSYGSYYFFINAKPERTSCLFNPTVTSNQWLFYLICTVFAIQGILSGTLNAVCFTFFLYILLVYLVKPDQFIKGIVCFFLQLYTLYACYYIYVWLGGTAACNLYGLLVGTLGLSSLLILNHKLYTKFFTKCILIEQCILPGLLLVYVASKYELNGQIFTVPVLPRISILIYGLIIILTYQAVRILQTHWKHPRPLKDLIAWGSALCIMGFNSYNHMGLQVPTDLHHPFENIIGFHQIVQMGADPFTQYIPISGMYSVLHGMVFQLFGKGLLSYYFITESILFLLIGMILLFLLRYYINRVGLLLFAVFFYSVIYNRIIFILPIMLLLSLPALIQQKNRWLQVWFLTSLFHGLYYPVFGAAVCLAYAPLGCYQFITWIRSTDFKTERKKASFWLGWLFCLGVFVACVPYLIGTYMHIKAMAQQSLLADGIARFGQLFGNSVLPFLSDSNVFKLWAIYLLTFLLPAIFVWITFALALYLFRWKQNHKITGKNYIKGCLALSLVIFMLVAFSYTAIRLDVNTLFARSNGILLITAFMVILYAYQYVRNRFLKYTFISVACFIPTFANLWGFAAQVPPLRPYYKLSSDYAFVKNDTHYKIGTGFISLATIQHIQTWPSLNASFNSYFGLPLFANYYIQNIPGGSILEPFQVKNSLAAQETVRILSRYPSQAFPYISPVTNYYLYYWLMTSGKYVWDASQQAFIPVSVTTPKEQIIEFNRNMTFWPSVIQMKKIPAAWGLSFSSLRSIFSPVSLSYLVKQEGPWWKITWENSIPGTQMDFIYLEFDLPHSYHEYMLYDMQGEHPIPQVSAWAKPWVRKNYNPGMYVVVRWIVDKKPYVIFAAMERGKLLIPLGAGSHWLLHNHTSLEIGVSWNKTNLLAAPPPIKKIEFLKLREIPS